MLTVETQDLAVLAEHGPAGRHARDVLAHQLRAAGHRGPLALVDAADGLVAVVLDCDRMRHTVLPQGGA